jgi:hypothetical protein
MNKTNFLVFLASCACLSASVVMAQDSLQSLKQELEDLRKRTQLLEQKIQQYEKSAAPAATSAVTNAPPVSPIDAARTEAGPAAGVTAPKTTPAWSPSAPITLMRSGSAYMNVSLDTLIDVGASTAHDVSKELLLGGHDPNQRGFSMPNTELALDGAVDPYFKGFANMVMKLDKNNATEFELEEAYLLSSSLPANLQLKAGQFNAEFGRANPQHPHQWSFVDQPVILGRMFGPDGLRNPGARLSWLAPLPWYTELFLGVFNGQGDTAFSFRDSSADGAHGHATVDRGISSMADLLYVPRLATSFDLTDTQTLVGGISAAFGANDTSYEAATQIYGADLYWRWKSPRANMGFPFVSWQSEFFYRHYEAGNAGGNDLPAETLHDWGFYSQLLWGFTPRWVAGLRGEYANGNDGALGVEDVYRGQRTRLSPALSFYPSEFSKVRLQYNYDYSPNFSDEHSVWLQLEFLLGAHGAHKF